MSHKRVVGNRVSDTRVNSKQFRNVYATGFLIAFETFRKQFEFRIFKIFGLLRGTMGSAGCRKCSENQNPKLRTANRTFRRDTFRSVSLFYVFFSDFEPLEGSRAFARLEIDETLVFPRLFL